jgi:hypothetical protein
MTNENQIRRHGDYDAFEWNPEHQVWQLKGTTLSAIEQLVVKIIHRAEKFPERIAEELGFAIDEHLVTVPRRDSKSNIGWMRVTSRWHFDGGALYLTRPDDGMPELHSMS